MQRAQPELRALTGARFFAAAAVVAFHFLRSREPELHGIVDVLVARGYVGVSFFFVLSGFVLTYNYGGGVLAGPHAVRSYALARFARIYPLYLASLALGFLAALPWLSKQPLSGSLVLQHLQVLTLLNAFHHHGMFHLNWAAWSLSVEATFYLMLPWLLARLERASTAQLLVRASASYAITMLAIAAFVRIDPDGLGHPLLPSDNGRYAAYFKFFPAFHFHAFLWGVVSAILFARFRPRLEALPSRTRELLLAVPILSVIALLLWLPDSTYLALNDGLLAPAFALWLPLLASPKSLLSRALGSSPVHLLGRISYAIYILHVPFYLWLKDRCWLGSLEYVVLLLVLSLLAWACIEEPARRFLRKLDPCLSTPA